MSNATILRRRLMAAANGEWNPGFAIDPDTVMHTLGGDTEYVLGFASVLTPLYPIYDGELNVTYYIGNQTVAGQNINNLVVSPSNGTQKAPSYHLYKGQTKSSFYSMTTSGNAFNRVLTRGTGKSVSEEFDGIKFCVWMFGAEESYAYIAETGRILFAGRNTVYYGKTNIND